MAKKDEVFKRIKGGLIVSCQALPDEPLYSSYIMSRIAYAAQLGGACGIRANTCEDIIEIKKTVGLPIIGIFKKVYPKSDVYITPTKKEVNALIECGADIIAIDATQRIRPYGQELDTFFEEIRNENPDLVFMADCSNIDEGKHAADIGFDCVATTLCGYTKQTEGCKKPNFELVERMAKGIAIPVIAEGGIATTEHLQKVYECGAFSAVIGTAITRPKEITMKFVESIKCQSF